MSLLMQQHFLGLVMSRSKMSEVLFFKVKSIQFLSFCRYCIHCLDLGWHILFVCLFRFWATPIDSQRLLLDRHSEISLGSGNLWEDGDQTQVSCCVHGKRPTVVLSLKVL